MFELEFLFVFMFLMFCMDILMFLLCYGLKKERFWGGGGNLNIFGEVFSKYFL